MNDIIAHLQDRLTNDQEFNFWMTEHWNALCIDITFGSNLYPYFYDKIEEFYEGRG